MGDAFTSSCGAARNPDPKAQWPRKRNWNNSRPASWTVANTERLCTGSRQSKDVIVYLGQKTHSSYDATHANTLNVSLTQRRLASMRQLLGPRRKQPGVSYKPWYCPGPGRLGFYNNWFVTKISWWLEDHRVAAGA